MVCRTHKYANAPKTHFADGGKVHTYGTPTTYTPPDPNRVQRKPSPPTKEGIAAYEAKAKAEARARMKAKEADKKPATPKPKNPANGGLSAVVNRKRDIESGIDKASE